MLKELTPPQAYELLNADTDAVLVDVRSTMEHEYVGHPVGAIHVAIKQPPAWDTDPDFVEAVNHKLDEARPNADIANLPILLLCRSGKRSELAAQLLEQAGFKDTYNILDGFEGDKDEQGHRNTVSGWRFHQLPWEQS